MRTRLPVRRYLLPTLLVTMLLPLEARQGQVSGQVVGLPQAPRDAPPPRPGTGVISGVVTAADTGLPMRGAVVMLMGQGAASPASRRSVATDTSGYFEFAGLAAGTYNLRADPGNTRGQYIGAAYGTTTMEAVGKPIALKDGQRLDDVNLALRRGGAIEGRVLDEFGEPAARVAVYPMRVAGGGTAFMRAGPGAQTDDHGRFRLFGLTPADYIVAAESRGMGGMGMPATEGVTEGFVTTFSPSAVVEREAARVRVTPGGEVSGVHIQLVRTRTFRISGRAFDSQGQPILRPMIMLGRQQPGGFGSTSTGPMQMEPDGRFTFRDVVPGEYRLAIRPGGMGGPPGSQPAAPARQEFATMPLYVSADIDDLVLVTSPGVTVAGSVVFADGAPLKPPTGLRVFTQPGDRFMMMGPPPNATVDEELRFTLTDVFGPLHVRLQPLPPGYALESVRVGGRDITDEAFEFRAVHSGQLELVVTSRVGRLEGQVTDDDGAPAGPGLVLLLSEDREKWRMNGSRARTASIREGAFSVNAVLPGRYYVVAVAQEIFTPGPDPGPEFFEAFVKYATAVVLNEGETRTLDLRLLRGELGR
jgi:hypothetical protein